MKITLYVYKSSMVALLNLVHEPGQYSLRYALGHMSLEELTLLEWRGRFTPHQILTWQMRTNQKPYALNLPITVALALWKVLRNVDLDSSLLELAGELDSRLINNGFTPKNLVYAETD